MVHNDLALVQHWISVCPYKIGESNEVLHLMRPVLAQSNTRGSHEKKTYRPSSATRHALVVLVLLRRELHPHDHLLLFGQRLDIFLHAPQQDGRQVLLRAHFAGAAGGA